MFKKIKQLFKSNIKKTPVENKPSPEIPEADYVYVGASKEDCELYQNEKNNTWKHAEQLIGKPIKLLEIKITDRMPTMWNSYYIFCQKRIYDGEILSVDGATVKYNTASIDDNGNRTVCTRYTCLHDDQKYRIIEVE